MPSSRSARPLLSGEARYDARLLVRHEEAARVGELACIDCRPAEEDEGGVLLDDLDGDSTESARTPRKHNQEHGQENCSFPVLTAEQSTVAFVGTETPSQRQYPTVLGA